MKAQQLLVVFTEAVALPKSSCVFTLQPMDLGQSWSGEMSAQSPHSDFVAMLAGVHVNIKMHPHTGARRAAHATEMYRLRCMLRSGPGNSSRRLLSVQSCLQSQQCGHRRLVRISSGFLSHECGSGIITCSGFCQKWSTKSSLRTTCFPLPAFQVASFVSHFVAWVFSFGKTSFFVHVEVCLCFSNDANSPPLTAKKSGG